MIISALVHAQRKAAKHAALAIEFANIDLPGVATAHRRKSAYYYAIARQLMGIEE